MTASILDTIVATKKQEIASLPNMMPKRASGPSFIDAILQRHPALIAEIKPKSPSGGLLLNREGIPNMVKLYNQHAQAISVLCDEQYFGGGFDLLNEVRMMTEKPLLAKDVIISTRQIDHAVNNGANAILLIAAILERLAFVELASHAVDLNLDVLLEVHSKEEIEKSAEVFDLLSADKRKHVLIGINNRDLHTLKTDLQTTEKLAPFVRKLLPGIRGLITESGIHTREDIKRLAPFVQGFLIGTSILKANDPVSHLHSLFAS
ncbi:MAG: indole-3-glycerol phosphate synthase TrpC [Candidatus Peregrinibacteria bacterium]|nr:indole-3-glycerol phosphate synthase TrpC [Candidatus Peregrinibacteria bacterium]